jgi:uncharacterized membrane protein YcaP (DUF421 family)
MDELGRVLLGAGLKAEQLDPWQSVGRAVLIYIVVLALVRLGKKRMLARASAFDVIVAIVIGSMAGRSITGNAPLSTALAGIAALIAMHWLFSAVALRWHGFGLLVKGKSKTLIRDGQVDEAMLRREHMTADDLAEDLRGQGKSGTEGVAEARLERSGELSVVTASQSPRVIDVEVRDGVQRVRLEIG